MIITIDTRKRILQTTTFIHDKKKITASTLTLTSLT